MIMMIRFISDYITHNHNHQMATNFYFYCLSCSCYIHVFFYTYQCLSFIQVKQKNVLNKIFFFFSFLALKISLYYPLFNGGFDTIYFLCTCLANIEFKKKMTTTRCRKSSTIIIIIIIIYKSKSTLFGHYHYG